MTLIPLHIQSEADLTLRTYKNWCQYHIGNESATSWWVAEPYNSGKYRDYKLFQSFIDTGTLYNIVFYNSVDATAFRLQFGL